LTVPNSDLLILVGDWTTQTTSCEPTRFFNRWLGELPIHTAVGRVGEAVEAETRRLVRKRTERMVFVRSAT
jgi:hypothetical protein